MITQSQIKTIIECEFVRTYETKKVNVVAKAAAKFMNKYDKTHLFSCISIVDACIQMYSVEKDLFVFLEREKLNYIVKNNS
jgi:hypothetical protein